MKKIPFFLLVLFISHLNAQVISWQPEFPSIHDTITITYNSSLGNGALVNTNTIFAHTGVINNYSSSISDWMHIPVEWHEGPDSLIQLNSIGGNLYEMKFKIKSFYGLSNNEGASCLNFVFRNDNGSIAGSNLDGSDFFI